MRTTLTLEPDVAGKIKAEMRRTGHSFKQVVNDMLRQAYLLRQPKPAAPPFQVKARSLGEFSHLNYDDISELIEYGEGPSHR